MRAGFFLLLFGWVNVIPAQDRASEALMAAHDGKVLHRNETGHEVPDVASLALQDLLGPTQRIWSATDRLTPKELKRPRVPMGNKPKDLRPIDLKAYLYLAVDTSGGVFNHLTAAVLDRTRSMYLATVRPWTRAFLNMYFDLCEMERQRMEKALNVPGMTVEEARRIHAHHSALLADELDRFMVRTRDGRARTAMGPWNRLVQDVLGIDNLAVVDALTLNVDVPLLSDRCSQPSAGFCHSAGR